MATLSDLETRFKNRLGITTLSTVGQAQVREALNAAVARLAGDGTPGLTTNYFSAETSGASTLTISAHSANTSTVTFTAVPTTRVYPGDVVKFSDGTHRMIYATSSQDASLASTEYDFGSPIPDAQTGNVTIYQRCIQLPTAGRIVDLIDVDNLNKITPDPNAIEAFGLEAYDIPSRFTQGFDGTYGYAVLWPVHTTPTQLAIKQYESLSTLGASTDLPWPDETLDSVLAKAVDIWRNWRTGGIGPIEASRSKSEVQDTHSGTQVNVPRKPMVRGRGGRP